MMNLLLAIDFENLHTLLRSLYDEMMPLCSGMAGVARAIAGLGALFYSPVRRPSTYSRCSVPSPSACAS